MQLERNEIHIWNLDQNDFSLDEVESYCLSWLNDIELARFHRYQFDRSRKQLLLGRFLLRHVLSEYDADIAPANWQFTSNAYGKPEIAAQQQKGGLYFNISHSGSRVVLAVARSPSIGIDIEFAEKNRRVEKIAHRFFSASETACLLALKEDEWLIRFYELWTLKEAYIKACGLGLAIPLKDFSYSFPAENGLAIDFEEERGDAPQNWQLWQVDAGAEYKLSLALKKDGNSADIERIRSWNVKNFDVQSEQATSIHRSNDPQ